MFLFILGKVIEFVHAQFLVFRGFVFDLSLGFGHLSC